jgi:hypothetical protein
VARLITEEFLDAKGVDPEVVQLIRQIIERYDLNRDLDMKDHIYLVSPQFIEEKVKKYLKYQVKLVLLQGLGCCQG